MEATLQQIAAGLVLMVCGAMGTGIIWIVKTLLRHEKDITAAHQKLRSKN